MYRFTALAAAAALLGRVSGQATIGSVSLSGNGCPQDSNATVVGIDSNWIYLDLGNAFNVAIGPNSTIVDHTKNCEVHLTLSSGGSVQYGVTGAYITGYAQLDPNVTLTWFETAYFSQDASATETVEASAQGGGEWAQSRAFMRYDPMPAGDIVYGPCGADGILNFDLRAALTSSDEDSEGAVSVADLGFGYDVALRYQSASC